MNTWENDIHARGLEIFRLMDTGPPALFDKKRWTGMLMNLAMGDTDLKVRLFRFVDVLPALTTPEMLTAPFRDQGRGLRPDRRRIGKEEYPLLFPYFHSRSFTAGGAPGIEEALAGWE